MKAVIVVAVIAVGVLGMGASYSIASHIEHAEIDVVSKERLVQLSSDGKGSSLRNFVYTPDETYVVEDSLWNGHFRAGTVYAKIREGQRCKVTLSGHRFGFLSMYQNIIAAECGEKV